MKLQVTTHFTQWITGRLHEYIQKGFAMDDERFKRNVNRYFRELLQRIRDIRSSELAIYQYSNRYLWHSNILRSAQRYYPPVFFAAVQNKMHNAAHQHTTAEVIYQRVDADKPMVEITNFKGDNITRNDVKIANNYLSEKELQVLNLLVSPNCKKYDA